MTSQPVKGISQQDGRLFMAFDRELSAWIAVQARKVGLLPAEWVRSVVRVKMDEQRADFP
jgi:hypothetical protein